MFLVAQRFAAARLGMATRGVHFLDASWAGHSVSIGELYLLRSCASRCKATVLQTHLEVPLRLGLLMGRGCAEEGPLLGEAITTGEPRVDGLLDLRAVEVAAARQVILTGLGDALVNAPVDVVQLTDRLVRVAMWGTVWRASTLKVALNELVHIAELAIARTAACAPEWLQHAAQIMASVATQSVSPYRMNAACPIPIRFDARATRLHGMDRGIDIVVDVVREATQVGARVAVKLMRSPGAKGRLWIEIRRAKQAADYALIGEMQLSSGDKVFDERWEVAVPLCGEPLDLEASARTALTPKARAAICALNPLKANFCDGEDGMLSARVVTERLFQSEAELGSLIGACTQLARCIAGQDDD